MLIWKLEASVPQESGKVIERPQCVGNVLLTDIIRLKIETDGKPNHIKPSFCQIMHPTKFIKMFPQVACFEVILNISSSGLPWEICPFAYSGDSAIIFSPGRKSNRKNMENVMEDRMHSISMFLVVNSQDTVLGIFRFFDWAYFLSDVRALILQW